MLFRILPAEKLMVSSSGALLVKKLLSLQCICVTIMNQIGKLNYLKSNPERRFMTICSQVFYFVLDTNMN